MIKFLKKLFKKEEIFKKEEVWGITQLERVVLVSYGEARENHIIVRNRVFSRKWDAEIFADRQREKGLTAELFYLIVH